MRAGHRSTQGKSAAAPGFLRLLLLCLLLAAAGGVVPGNARAFDGSSPQIEPIPLAPTRLDSVPIGLPPVLRTESGVHDPVFALLIGLVDSGTYGKLSGERLEEELKRTDRKTVLPYKSVLELDREPAIPGRTAEVRIHFRGPLDLPVPYSILGYHPGSFTASEICRFREWILGRVQIAYTEEKDGKEIDRTTDLEDVHLFGITEGKVKIDIDAWLDALVAGSLDDTDVTCLMLCRYKGEWVGFAMGYTEDGGGRSGVMSFAKDEILFPVPPELKAVGRQMRRRTELLHTRWEEVGGKLGTAQP